MMDEPDGGYLEHIWCDVKYHLGDLSPSTEKTSKIEMQIKTKIMSKRFEGLISKYESQKLEAEAVVLGYLSDPSHVGEHPQLSEEIDNALESYSNAQDKLDALKKISKELSFTLLDKEDAGVPIHS